MESINDPGRFANAQDKINARKFEQFQAKATRSADTSWDEVTTTEATSDIPSLDSRSHARLRRPTSGFDPGYGPQRGTVLNTDDGVDRWWLTRRQPDVDKGRNVWVAR
jgi:hypothetical protein